MAKILAIDDTNDNLISLKAIINDTFPDSVLYTSLNGPNGIELAISKDPDVILLDIIMPVMDGFEVCRILKADERVSGIPVIFLTSLQGDKKSRIKALEVGAEAFLSKPIDETELIAQIKAMIKIKEANEQKQDEHVRLKKLVAERTQKLELSQIATLNLLAELRAENEARKKTEETLRESEQQLRGIFNNLQDGYFQADQSGKFTLVSPSAARMYSYGTVEELIGKDAESLYADPNLRGSLISELKRSGRIEDFVNQGRKKDGTVFWVSMNIQLRYNKEGQILGTEGVVRDITDRKLAEEKLKRSFSLLNATLESTADGILVVDKNGKITNFNKKFVEFWQIPESVISSHNDNELISFVLDQLKDPESFLKKVRELYSSEEETSFDLLEFNDGRIIERYSQSQKYEGQNVGRVWSFRDITKRRKAEEAMLENLQLFHGLFNASPDAIILIDPHDPTISWPIVDCNQAACDMNGYTRDELVGYSIDIFNELEGSVEERKEYFKDLRKKGTIHKEAYHRHKDGHIFTIEVVSSIVTLGGKEMVLGIDRNITERKRVEEALRESEKRYRQLVERSPFGIAIYQEGKFVYVNPAGVDIFGGISAQDIIGKSVLSIVHPDSIDEVVRRMKLVASGNSVPALEEKLVRFDGTLFDAEVIALNTTYNDKPAGQVIVWDITNRKQAEEALRESQILYHSFVESMPAGVFRKDSEGRYIFVNTVFCQLKGLTSAEILGKTPRELSEYETAKEAIQPSKNPNRQYTREIEADQHHEYIMRTGKSIEIEEVYPNQYGSSQYLQVVKSPVFSSNGKIIGSQGVQFDISERKRVEIKLIETNELNNSLFQTIPFGIDIVDEFGNILYLNENMEKLFGLGGIGQKCWDLYRDDKCQCNNCPLLSGVNIGKTDLYETSGVLDGRIFQISHTGMLFRGKNAMLEIFQDITERKKSEIELIEAKEKAEESEEKLKEAQKTSHIGHWNWDLITQELVWSDEIFNIFGVEKESFYVTSKSFENAIHPDDRNEFFKTRNEGLKNSGEINLEHRIVRPNGEIRYVMERSKILRDENKLPINVFGTVQDITDIKQIELELIKAKEQAVESDRLKSAFLANMSHEVRTPLNSIIGFSELMTDPDFDFAQQIQFARLINVSGNNLLAIISDIMDISKIEAGQVQIRKRVHSASNLISDIQKEYSFKAIEKGVELQLDPSNPEDDVFIESDEDRLRQILINFVGNAIKFTEKGSISIGLATMGDFVQFHVKDTGIGVPRGFQEKIFERFRQVETGNTRKYGGNGLGLSISKSLVELLGGTIWVESEEGKGSTFYIKIPK